MIHTPSECGTDEKRQRDCLERGLPIQQSLDRAFWQDDRSPQKRTSHIVYDRINVYYEEYLGKEGVYHFLYTTIVGPSGIGKSFVVKEPAAKQDQYVV